MAPFFNKKKKTHINNSPVQTIGIEFSYIATMLIEERVRVVEQDDNQIVLNLCNGHNLIIKHQEETIQSITINQNDFGRKYNYTFSHFYMTFDEPDNTIRVETFQDKFSVVERVELRSINDLIGFIFTSTDKHLVEKNEDIGCKGKDAIQQMVYLGEWD